MLWTKTIRISNSWGPNLVASSNITSKESCNVTGGENGENENQKKKQLHHFFAS